MAVLSTALMLDGGLSTACMLSMCVGGLSTACVSHVRWRFVYRMCVVCVHSRCACRFVFVSVI